MNKFQGSKAQRAAAAIATAAVLAAGLMTATASMATNAFDNKLSAVIKQVKADPNYKAIPMSSTAEREWFFNECEALYQKKISKAQYLADGARQFPGYDASFSELADLLAS